MANTNLVILEIVYKIQLFQSQIKHKKYSDLTFGYPWLEPLQITKKIKNKK